MKRRVICQRITAMLLAVVLLTGTLVPVTEVHAVHDNKLSVSMPTSPVRDNDVALGVILAIPGAIASTLKGVGAVVYASKNNTGGVGEWAKLAMAYLSGNADKTEGFEDLKSVMAEQHKFTQEAIAGLKKDIANLQKSVSDLQTELKNTIEYTELRTALNQFYTEFFASAYDELETAYLNITEVMEDPISNDVIIRAKMDDLYMKAYKLRTLQGYITGDINFESKSIIDLYYEYMLKVNGVQPGDSESYKKIVEKCQDFTLKLYAADAFQKYCLTYASSYQLNYVYENMDEMAANGEFIGYIVDGTLDGSTNKMTLQEIKRNIAKVESGLDVVSAKTAENLVKIYLIDTYAQYSEGTGYYVAPIADGKLSAYSGASYGMASLPEELQAVFGKDFSFTVSDENAAEVTSTGNVKVKGNPGDKFTVSYVYGEGVLEEPLTVYSVEFTVAERKWAGGYGTAEAPYLISTLEHMKAFASDSAYWAAGVHVKLISDIDAAGNGIGKIAEFNGSFDGANHSIKNVSSSGGLFGTNKGEVKNLTLDTVTLKYSAAGSVSAGGIVDINSGTIENCKLKNSTITVYCHNHKSSSKGFTSFTVQVGGIAGSATSGSAIRYCYVENTRIQGQASTRELYDAGYVYDDGTTSTVKIYIGGIAGITSEATVENSNVVKTNVSSKIFAAYYKWKLLWSHTYNKVNATIYSGIIAGNQSGTFSNNGYYESDSSDKTIQKIARTGSLMHEDSGFVSASKNTGAQGSAMSQAHLPLYTMTIEVSKMPSQTLYSIGDVINTAGLEVADSFGRPVYGYSVSDVSTDSDGKKTVTVEYMGCKATFEVTVGCLHKNIEYVEAKWDKEASILYTAGIFCNDCEKYSSGREEVPHASCEDDDKDHICNVCGGTVGTHEEAKGTHVCEYCKQTLSECEDADRNHACEKCGKAIGEHKAAAGGHICAYCDKIVTYCEDNDKNHICDICSAVLGTHKAAAGSHSCSYCGKAVSICTDIDKDHSCDICGKTMGEHKAAAGESNCAYCGKFIQNAYEIGDVNGDGKINSRDALMIKQYVVKMIELTEDQKMRANVYCDFDSEGNPNITSRDAMLLQQFIVKMDVTLGGKVK